jgi:adenylate cyclase
MTPMVETITAHQGTIDKFIGDAIMAYWNAPVEVDEHADKAVQSALEQLKLLKVLNQVLQEKFAVTINIGIGIHTGEVTIGEMGSSGRSDYTIIGDNVNLASRLEGLTKVYGARIIISQETKMQLTGTYILRSLDIVQVKGKDHAVEIFEVFMDDNIDFEALSTYEKALMLYRSKELSKAHTLFKDLSENNDDLLYKLYCQRCESALKHGVENFKVITKMQSK